MFNFSIDFVGGLNGTEQLANMPIDGIPLYSTLDRLINCLQGNFARTLCISHDNKIPSDLEIIPKDILEDIPKDRLENLIEPKNPQEKEDFFWGCAHKKLGLGEEHHVGEIYQINDVQFHILCDAIKESITLQSLELSLPISLTEYQENELVTAISESSSIRYVTLRGCISSAALDAIKDITKRRPELQINSYLANTSAHSLEEATQKNQEAIERILLNSQNNTTQHTPGINMHLLQGFIAVLGAATVATSFVLLYATALNPIGLILEATGGAVAFAWGTYSFFSSDKSKQTGDIKPDDPIPAI